MTEIKDITEEEIQAAVDRITEHRNAIIRGDKPYIFGQLQQIEADLSALRRIWALPPNEVKIPPGSGGQPAWLREYMGEDRKN